jgi:transcription termination factor NusB
MTSEKQIDANRRNALLSTGPRTDAGRNRSRMNALRHGLTGQVTTMTEEDRAAHDQFSKALIQDLAPHGAMETQLAQRIATDSWRLNRISAIEDNLFALGLSEHSGQLMPDHAQIDAALTTARVFTQESKNLQLLTLYEQRINRSIQKNLAMLQSLQATRKAHHEAAMQEAAALLKLSEMKGLEYFPTKDGFLFSTTQIHAAIDRQQRLERSSAADFSKYKPRKFQTVAA